MANTSGTNIYEPPVIDKAPQASESVSTFQHIQTKISHLNLSKLKETHAAEFSFAHHLPLHCSTYTLHTAGTPVRSEPQKSASQP
jgi:hypothetical protein